jgi:hypothetical protein
MEEVKPLLVSKNRATTNLIDLLFVLDAVIWYTNVDSYVTATLGVLAAFWAYVYVLKVKPMVTLIVHDVKGLLGT